MLKVPYIFICEGIDIENDGQDVSISKMFDVRTIKQSPSVLDELYLAFSILGEETDDGQEFTIKIRGKEFKASLPPLQYKFNGYDQFTLFYGKIGSLPVTDGETIYFEIHYKEKKLSEYPVKFKLKEVG